MSNIDCIKWKFIEGDFFFYLTENTVICELPNSIPIYFFKFHTIENPRLMPLLLSTEDRSIQKNRENYVLFFIDHHQVEFCIHLFAFVCVFTQVDLSQIFMAEPQHNNPLPSSRNSSLYSKTHLEASLKASISHMKYKYMLIHSSPGRSTTYLRPIHHSGPHICY